MRWEIFDVPAVWHADDCDVVTFGVKGLDQDVHVDPMTAVNSKDKNLSALDRGSRHQKG